MLASDGVQMDLQIDDNESTHVHSRSICLGPVRPFPGERPRDPEQDTRLDRHIGAHALRLAHHGLRHQRIPPREAGWAASAAAGRDRGLGVDRRRHRAATAPVPASAVDDVAAAVIHVTHAYLLSLSQLTHRLSASTFRTSSGMVLALLDELIDEFRLDEVPAVVVEERPHHDQWGILLAGFVPTRAGEAIGEHEPAVPLRHDRQPGRQVAAEDLALRLPSFGRGAAHRPMATSRLARIGAVAITRKRERSRSLVDSAGLRRRLRLTGPPAVFRL